MALPPHGSPPDTLLLELQARKAHDLPWRDGKVFAYVYDAGPAVRDIGHQAYDLYLDENGLDPTVFPSVLSLENDVVGVVRDILRGGPEVSGSFTSGGTESCMLAVKTARDEARARGVTTPNLVCPVTAHAAFHKACHYLGLELRLVPVGPDFRVRAEDIEAKIDSDTALVVVSAPGYAHGVVDPVREVAAVAAGRGVLCHVDACIGGFVLSFFRQIGRPVPEFDFTVPGVTSMSIDLHKYGFSPKGASVVLYRDAALRQHQFFTTAAWSGYVMVNPTIQSSKSGGPIAAAWAVMNHLGQDGYAALAATIAEATDRIIDGVERIPGLRLLARPDTNLVAVEADGFSIFAVSDAMRERGWYLQPQLGSAGSRANIHLSIGPNAAPHVDAMLADLRWAVEQARSAPMGPTAEEIAPLLVMLEGALDEASLQAIFLAAGMEGTGLPARMAPISHLLDALPGTITSAVLSRYFGMIYRAS